MTAKPKYYLYIMKCRDGSLYTGIARDPAKRAALHNAGKGSAYVRSRGGGKIAYTETCKGLGAALRREAAIKKLTRSQKLALTKKAK